MIGCPIMAALVAFFHWVSGIFPEGSHQTKTCFIMATVLLFNDFCQNWGIDWNSTKYSDPYHASTGHPQTLRELALCGVCIAIFIAMFGLMAWSTWDKL